MGKHDDGTSTGRRSVRGIAATAVVAVGLIAGQVAATRAQEATPAPLGFELAPGVTAEDIAPPEERPSLFRIQIAGGTTWDEVADPSDPSIVLVYQEAGTLTWTVEAPITVFRADAAGQPGEAVAAGTAFETNPGDYMAAPPMVTVSVANEGDAPASFVAASLLPPQAGDATPTS